MKAKLLENVMGLTAGAVVEIVSQGDNSSVVRNDEGDTVVPNTSIEVLKETDPFAREPEPPVERLAVHDDTEAEARAMYDDYSAAVGGKAFNGDDLPPASGFFEDPSKQKQANAWRTVAGLSEGRLIEKFVGPDLEDAGDPDQGKLLLDTPDPESTIDEIPAENEPAPENSLDDAPKGE